MREQSKLWLAFPVLCGVCGASLEATRGHAAQLFVRGDVDESGVLTISDAVNIFQYLFQGAQEAVGCEDAADVDDDGALTITDGIFVLNFLFKGGAPPKAPFPLCGLDPTEDALGCNTYDACLKSFHFYGVELSAGAVFYVVDRTVLMVERGELEIAKGEVTQNIDEFSPGVEFGVVFFDQKAVKFPKNGSPAEATPETRENATEFIGSIQGGGDENCLREGLIAALQFAETAKARTKLIIFVGDGSGTCESHEESAYLRATLKEVTERNNGNAWISTIGVLQPMPPSPLNEKFLIDLAEKNGGTYTRIDR